jgi:hypothetical protein
MLEKSNLLRMRNTNVLIVSRTTQLNVKCLVLETRFLKETGFLGFRFLGIAIFILPKLRV